MSPQEMAAKLQTALEDVIMRHRPQITADKYGVTLSWLSVEGDREAVLFHLPSKKIEALSVEGLGGTIQQDYDAVVQERRRLQARTGWWQQRLQEARVSVV